MVQTLEQSAQTRSTVRAAFILTGLDGPTFAADLNQVPQTGDYLRLDGHPATQSRLWRVARVEWRLETCRRGERPEVQAPANHLPGVIITLVEDAA